ncbi:MAG: FtsX-like permease family protein, partial [Thermoplasmata archaeon]
MVGTRAVSGSRRGNGYTGRLSFARYALDSIVRNRRRTLYAVLGITLAVSLIAGSLIAVDSASIGLIRERLENVPADFTGSSYSYLSYVDEARYERVTDNLLEVEGVEHAICVVGFQGWAFFNSEGDRYEAYDYYYYYGSGTLLMVPDDPSILIERYQIYGDAPAPGTVAVPQDIASSLDIEPGDEIICGYETYEYDYVNETGYVGYYNVSFEVSQIWDQSGEVEDSQSNWYWYEDTPGEVTISGHRNPIVMYSDDFLSAVEALPEQQSPGLSEEYIVWIDREDFLHLANIPSTLESLETLSGRLDRAAREADVDFYTPLAYVLSQMGGDLTSKKVVFIALSLPVVVMGVYLSLVGVEMGMTERRREVGVQKSRGAGNGQVLASLVSESVVLGVMSSLLGLALGLVLSRFLVVAVSGMLSTGLDDPSLATF